MESGIGFTKVAFQQLKGRAKKGHHFDCLTIDPNRIGESSVIDRNSLLSNSLAIEANFQTSSLLLNWKEAISSATQQVN